MHETIREMLVANANLELVFHVIWFCLLYAFNKICKWKPFALAHKWKVPSRKKSLHEGKEINEPSEEKKGSFQRGKERKTPF